MKPIDAPIRRSVLITPGSRAERLRRGVELACDSLLIDLEDGVAPSAKEQARQSAIQALKTLEFGHKERAVRVNAPGSLELARDLEALDLSRIDTLWIPKVESAEQLGALQPALPKGLPVVVSIETPRGLFQAQHIAQAARALSARSALFFGSGDYCMETGARPSDEGLRVPRALIVAAAAMWELQAIDAAYFLDPKDAVATRADAVLAREHGFDGKLVFHPLQIAPVNAVFAPDTQEVMRAKRLLAAFDAANERGQGTVIVDGVFLAIDTVRPLRRVLWMAERLGTEPKNS